MLTIGILGDDDKVAFEVMKEIFYKNKTDYFSASAKNSDEIRQAYMNAVLEKDKVLLLGLDVNKNYNSLNSLKFDILIFLLNEKDKCITLHSMLKEKNFLIINSDEELPKRIDTVGETMIITCGFNHAASVTVSSVEWEFADKIQCCLQRTLPTVDGEIVLPQEFQFCSNYDQKDIAKILAAVAAAVVSGLEI